MWHQESFKRALACRCGTPSLPASAGASVDRCARYGRAAGGRRRRRPEEIEIAVRRCRKLEAGQVNATLHTLDKLCAAFGVDVARLFSSKA